MQERRMKNGMKWAVTSVVALLVGASASDLMARPFTSANGRIIDADLVSVSGESVVIRRTDTRSTHTLGIAAFAEADQNYIREWQKRQKENRVPRMEVKVSSGKNQRSDRADSFDDRSGSFDLNVTFENRERDFEVSNATVTVWVFGVSCSDRNELVVFQRKSFPLSLAPGDKKQWQGAEVKYRFDDRAPAIWGHKYYGYLLEIQNASGKTIFVKSTPSKFEDHLEKARALKERDVCGSKLDKQGRRSGLYF